MQDKYFLLNYFRLLQKRWPIEISFRQTKGVLRFDGYPVRSIRSIERLWILLASTHLRKRVSIHL